MKTVRNILIELLDKKNDVVIVKYNGNSIMSGYAHDVYWGTSVFLRNCNATVESYVEHGIEVNVITIKDGEFDKWKL